MVVFLWCVQGRRGRCSLADVAGVGVVWLCFCGVYRAIGAGVLWLMRLCFCGVDRVVRAGVLWLRWLVLV